MVILRKRVKVKPEYLDSNLINYITLILQKQLKGSCDNEYGYILNVNKLNRIIDNKISRANSDIIYMVDVDVDILKPKVGDTYEGSVKLIIEHGLILEVESYLNIFIQTDKLTGYTISDDNEYFKGDNGDKGDIKLGSNIKVGILGVKYNDGNFDCFGQLS